MARERPTASDSTSPALRCLDGGTPAGELPLLTRAEARALRRSAPLTQLKLEQHLRPVAEQLRSVDPPRRVV